MATSCGCADGHCAISLGEDETSETRQPGSDADEVGHHDRSRGDSGTEHCDMPEPRGGHADRDMQASLGGHADHDMKASLELHADHVTQASLELHATNELYSTAEAPSTKEMNGTKEAQEPLLAHCSTQSNASHVCNCNSPSAPFSESTICGCQQSPNPQTVLMNSPDRAPWPVSEALSLPIPTQQRFGMPVDLYAYLSQSKVFHPPNG